MKNKYQHIFQNIYPRACADQNLVDLLKLKAKEACGDDT